MPNIFTDKINTPEMLLSKMDRQQHRANIFNRLMALGTMAGNDDIVVLDISYWQDHTRIDYEELSKHIDGVILRGTYSIWKDTRIDIHYENFRKYGVPMGSYAYLVGNQSAKAQADTFYAATIDKELNLGRWADIEDRRTGTALTRPIADGFMSACDSMFKQRTEIYTGVWAWLEIMKTGGHSHRKLWIANYYVSEPAMPKGGDWTSWWLWQFTDRGRQPGYYGNLDTNRFNGTKVEYNKWAESETTEPSTVEKQILDLQKRMTKVEKRLNIIN